MDNVVFRKSDIKTFELYELQGKTVEIVSVGKCEDESLMYMRNTENGDIYVVKLNELQDDKYKDCIVNNFNNVDFDQMKASLIVIYNHPKDYPKLWVARIWDMNRPTNVIAVNENIKAIRMLRPRNMTILKPS